MTYSSDCELKTFMQGLVRRNPGELVFHQAVFEVAQSIIPFLEAHPKYQNAKILERLTEPDRIISFRVCWQDDDGQVRVNRGYRVQHSNVIGPYKGGLRFHRDVSLATLKFLGFEQTFKNSLTGLPMGGAKGGSDFNPKGKSDNEIMRFCQSFMTELQRHIGPNTDVPAGDIGVGAREISYMYGQYLRLSNQFTGVLTGKGLEFGGSLIRKEATGYGVVYFMQAMLQHHGKALHGQRCLISGSGNVAQYTAEKLLQSGATVLSLSDSSGTIYQDNGFTLEQLAQIQELKNERRGRLKEYAEESGCQYFEGQTPWHLSADLVFPCATQNEISAEDASKLVQNGCIAVAEGANMPSAQGAVDYFQEANILYAPSKAANAGGVAVSGLEMTQNSMRMSWARDDLDNRLQEIMTSIHKKCVQFGSSDETVHVNYLKGANIAGFIKVADAMLSYGVI